MIIVPAAESVECAMCGCECEHPRTMCAGCAADVAANMESHRWDRAYWHTETVQARRAAEKLAATAV